MESSNRIPAKTTSVAPIKIMGGKLLHAVLNFFFFTVTSTDSSTSFEMKIFYYIFYLVHVLV